MRSDRQCITVATAKSSGNDGLQAKSARVYEGARASGVSLKILHGRWQLIDIPERIRLPILAYEVAASPTS